MNTATTAYTVDFVSKNGDADDQIADTCDGLYRADEEDSVADEAYDNAFEEAVGGGFGAWRLRNVYEDEYDDEDDRQRIRIEPIYDADSTVFFDLNAKRQDKSDARSCYVLTAMTYEGYVDQWGDDPASWPKEVSASEFDWATPDTVYVAEVYKVEERSETIRVFETIDGEEERYSQQDFEDNEELEVTLEAIGTKEVRQKKVKRRKVRKYIMSGSGILEDAGYIAGTEIPIVPVYGKRWFIDNIERCMGHVRLAKDAQRLKNMQLSKLGEISALTPIEKTDLFARASRWPRNHVGRRQHQELSISPGEPHHRRQWQRNHRWPCWIHQAAPNPACACWSVADHRARHAGHSGQAGSWRRNGGKHQRQGC